MKRGDDVWVCQDGKWGRRVRGLVVQTKNGYKVKVRFTYPGCAEHEEWFRRFPPKRSGWVRKAFFGGWAHEVDIFMPWFAVYPRDFNS